MYTTSGGTSGTSFLVKISQESTSSNTLITYFTQTREYGGNCITKCSVEIDPYLGMDVVC